MERFAGRVALVTAGIVVTGRHAERGAGVVADLGTDAVFFGADRGEAEERP